MWRPCVLISPLAFLQKCWQGAMTLSRVAFRITTLDIAIKNVTLSIIANGKFLAQNYLAILHWWIVLLPNCTSFQNMSWDFYDLFFILANVFLGVRYVAMFCRKKCGIQVLASLTPFIQTVWSLLRTPWLAKPAGKITEIVYQWYTIRQFFPQ